MIPVKLTLKGIYSYQEEQVIVFDKLAQEGLFGIFGPVGSGKSTIIEAMAFSIYGETERLNSRENRAQNMMNLKSKEMVIRFECLAGPRNDSPYLFSVKHTTTGKKNEIIRTERGVYKWESGQWLPTEQKAEEIIGLSYANFQRTIIIPQGKFSEFLHLGGAERTSALMEIFQLDKYDLDDKAKRLQEKSKTELQAVQAQLAGLEEINIESLNIIHERLLEITNLESQETILYNQAIEANLQWEEINNITSAIAEQSNLLSSLIARETDYISKEKELLRYETCLRLFKDLIDNREKLEAEYTRYLSAIKVMEEKLAEQKKQKEIVNIDFLKHQQQYLKRDENNVTLRSIRKLAELKKVEKDLIQLNIEETEYQKKLSETETNIVVQLELINELGKQLDNIKLEMPDLGIITALQQWFAEKKLLQNQIDTYTKQQTDAQKRLEQPLAELLNKIAEVPDGLKFSLSIEKDIPDGFQVELDKLYNIENINKSKLDKEWEEWQVEKTLKHYANHLEPGKPCPLCGATDHPKVESTSFVQADKELALLELRDQQQKRIEYLKQLQRDIAYFNNRRQEQEKELMQIGSFITSKKEELQRHYKQWVWQKPYNPENESSLENVKETLNVLAEKVKQTENEIKQARAKREDIQVAKDLTERALHLIRSNTSVAHEKTALLKEEIQGSDLVKHSDDNPEALLEMAITLEGQIKKTEEDYRNADIQLQAIQQEISTLEGRISSGKQILVETEKKRTELDATIAQRLSENGFADQNTVKQILLNEMDITHAREEIRLYRSQLENTKSQLLILEEKRNGREYRADEHAAIQDELKLHKEKLDNLKEEMGRQKQALEQQKSLLDKKEKLAKELIHWQEKYDNLQTIRNLFRSRGFVDYVSSVYLQSLCHTANERFRKLSRQSLSLEMTENNQFQIRDYLNEGKTRHIKTLSGGQTFQAALSLALALADNTQKIASRKQNFFFMDEGFGSLDKESLRTVMETLKTLRKENRIVGIISHVEELQQEMDVYINITQSGSRGSLINYSWEN